MKQWMKVFDILEQLETENYTVEQLEEMLIEHYSDCYDTEDAKFNALLCLRKRKLDEAFEWTPESLEKIVLFDKKLNKCFEIAHNEIKRLLPEFKKRIKDRGDLFNDFEIEINISPSIYEIGENGELGNAVEGGIEEILMNYEEEIPHHTDRRDLEGYLNKHQKQEYDRFYSQILKDYEERYISVALFRFHEYSEIWSIPDILKINRLWMRLNVDYQYDIYV
jgi:hypothetical protein